MRIRQIQLRNFRNLRDVVIKPRNPLILCGENNTGKTNILYALRLLLGVDANRLSLEITEEDINEEARLSGENWFTISVEIGDFQLHKELEAVFLERLGKENDETFVTIQGDYKKQEDNEYGWKVTLRPPPGRANDAVQFTSRMAKMIPLYYLPAIRDASVELRPAGRSMLANALDQVDFKDVENEVIKSIRNANIALGGNASIKTLSEGITGLLDPNIPQGRGKISIVIATEDTTQLKKGVKLSLQRDVDSRSYDISRHGTGLQNIVLIAMFRYLLNSDPIANPILAVEEPEVHLHVNAQRTLFNDLAKISRPIILTTHSPTIVSSADPLSLVRLKPKGKGEVTAHQLVNSSISTEDKVSLTRMMRSGRADALFARTIMLVEGPCEVTAIPAFARYLEYDLDRDGVSVLSADGNSFSYILRACDTKNFSIPSVVVFDADALENSSSLLKDAYKADLIKDVDLARGRNASAIEKIKILENIGWIAAKSNFEEEVALVGYLDIILNVIERTNHTKSLDAFLQKKNEEKNAHSVAEFLRSNRAGSSIKVPVSQEIAEQVSTVREVPKCYEEAIKKAINLAVGHA